MQTEMKTLPMAAKQKDLAEQKGKAFFNIWKTFCSPKLFPVGIKH